MSNFRSIITMLINQSKCSFPIAILIGCWIIVSTNAVGPQVNTTVGMIEGSVSSMNVATDTKDINIYLGVPYATPPVGDKRFSLGTAKRPMPGIYNATYFRPICPQDKAWLEAYTSSYPVSDFAMAEDCLFLNIYAPVGGSSKATMIYIHGGYYLTGTANMHDGSALAAYGDVVVVTINYRLGVLGFLSRETNGMDGNYGFYDQILAIKWVSDNIEKFGGDKENITLFGESAGAASVALHSIANYNNLFRRVILESGSGLNPWTLANSPREYTMLMSSQFACGSDLKKLFDCLRSKPIVDIVSAQLNISARLGRSALGPVINKLVLPLSPTDFYTGIDPNITKTTFASLDYLIGTNSQEGAFIFNSVMNRFRNKFNDSVVGLPRHVFNLIIDQTAKGISANHSKSVSAAIKYRYTDHSDKNDGFKTAKNYINSVSDSLFFDAITKWAQFHVKLAGENSGSDVGSTYFYYYDHSGSWVSKEPWREGADHGDELPIVFGHPFLLPGFTQDEKDLSAAIMTFWTNFAKTGDPNSPNVVAYPVTWPKYLSGAENYIRLTSDKAAGNLIGKKLFANRVAFWGELIPDMLSSLPAPTAPKACPVRPVTKPTGGAETRILSLWVLSVTAITAIFLSKYTFIFIY